MKHEISLILQDSRNTFYCILSKALLSTIGTCLDTLFKTKGSRTVYKKTYFGVILKRLIFISCSNV